MAGRFDVEPQQILPYGSPGAAGFRGFQEEMLRRAAFAEAAQERQRQAALDKQAAEEHAARLQLAKEQLASQTEVRKSQEHARQLATEESERKSFERLHGAGAAIRTPEERATVLRLYGPSALTEVETGTTATPATPATVAAMEEAGVEAPAAAPTSRKTTFAGSPAQQEEKKKHDIYEKIAKGEMDDVLDSLPEEQAAALRFQAIQATGGLKGALPKAPTTKKRTLADIEVDAADALSTPKDQRTPKQHQAIQTYRDILEIKGGPAAERQRLTIENRSTNREDQQTDRAINTIYQRVNKRQEPLDQMLSRAGRLTTVLTNGGGLGDATAAPEFLQIIAGGYGSGLRMTDTELNRINFSHSKLDEYVLLAKGLLSDRPPKLTNTQRADMNKLATYLAQRAVDENEVFNDYLDRINMAGSAGEARRLETEMKRKLDKELLKGFAPGTAPNEKVAPAAPKFTGGVR